MNFLLYFMRSKVYISTIVYSSHTARRFSPLGAKDRLGHLNTALPRELPYN